MTRVNKWITAAIISSWSIVSSATPITNSVGNVDILGGSYAVSILFDDSASGIDVANSFSALLPTITFTTELEAVAAVDAMSAAFPGFDWNPAATDFSVILGGTRVPYLVVGTDYSYTYIEDDLFGSVTGGPATVSVDDPNRYSFAEFEYLGPVDNVPAPPALALLGLGLAGLGWSRRKKA